MKNFKFSIILLVALAWSGSAVGQTWFELGGRFSFGPTVLFDQAIDDNNNHSLNINTGYSFGGAASANFGNAHGTAIEVVYATGKQEYDFSGAAGLVSGVNSIEWNSVDVYALYRKLYAGSYLEIGPKVSLVNSVDQSLSNNNIEVFGDVTDFYTDSYISGVLGFGGYFAGSRFFSVGLGLRFEYAFGKFTSSDGEEAGFPLPYEPTFDGDNLRNINVYGTLEIKIPIGRIAQVKCGERAFIFGGR